MGRTIVDPRQPPLIVPSSSWVPPRVADLPDFSQFEWLGFDTETHDLDLKTWGSGWPIKNGNVIGYSMATPGGGSYYLPVAHPEDNVDNPDMLREKLIHEMKNFRGMLIGLNVPYDVGWSSTEGILFPQARLFDVGYSEAALDEEAPSYSLDGIAKRRGVGGKDERLLREAAAAYGVDPKADMWRLPARFVGPYAESDADLPVRILEHQRPELDRERLWPLLDLEHELIPMMIEMRRRGVRVDLDGAERAQATCRLRCSSYLHEIKRLSGIEMLDPFDSQSCTAVMTKCGVSFPRTVTGKPSFTAPWMDAQPDPVCRLIAQARRWFKADRDFAGSMILGHQVNGRLYPQFDGMRSDEGGTVTGRFSCSKPNLQQVPSRDPEIGPLIRSLFLPEEGEDWAAIDYSAQEPRLQLHYANLINLPGAAEAVRVYHAEETYEINDRGERIYLSGPRTDYHSMVAKFTQLPRKRAKIINLAIPYGARSRKICKTMGLPTEFIEIRDRKTNERIMIEVAGPEGKQVLATYHERFPFMGGLMERCTRDADTRGFIRTIAGRMRHFRMFVPATYTPGYISPPLPYDEAVERYGENVVRFKPYKGLNALIQGSAADMMKMALRDLWRAGIVPKVTIHDENGLSVASRKEAYRAAEIMENTMQLAVPLVVDIDFGKSWGEARPISRVETGDD